MGLSFMVVYLGFYVVFPIWLALDVFSIGERPIVSGISSGSHGEDHNYNIIIEINHPNIIHNLNEEIIYASKRIHPCHTKTSAEEEERTRMKANGQGFVQRAGIIRWIRGHHECRWWRRGRQEWVLFSFSNIIIIIQFDSVYLQTILFPLVGALSRCLELNASTIEWGRCRS